ncbi:MAG: hypothetical protein ACI91B_004815 [Planctomycetota bacterium]|jgi:hypothetical protein
MSSGMLSAQSGPLPLSKDTTEMLVGRYQASEHWVQKAVVLLSLNRYWHPAGNQMILAAVRDKDPRLKAFGVEALLRSDLELLPKLATMELLDELIGKQLSKKNAHYQKRVGEVLLLMLPAVEATKKSEWVSWWRRNQETHQPEAWQAREQPKADGGGTSAAAQRAFDLYRSGLDLMLCLDSTGSMQPTIDALAVALGEMADILSGISPKLRVGVVHYKDNDELGKHGAEVVQGLSKNIRGLRKKLEKMRAIGGGDLPEAVLGGLDMALSKKMKWNAGANKIALLIGDAPPHPDEKQQAIDLARAAFEKPGSQNDKKATTGKRKLQKPFLTSAMGVVVEIGPDVKVGAGFKMEEFRKSQQTMRKDFKEIAKAGGGVYVEVKFLIDGSPPPTSKEKREAKKKGGGVASDATQKIVEHILVLSFGQRFKKEMQEFVRIFYAYKQAGMIK